MERRPFSQVSIFTHILNLSTFFISSSFLNISFAGGAVICKSVYARYIFYLAPKQNIQNLFEDYE